MVLLARAMNLKIGHDLKILKNIVNIALGAHFIVAQDFRHFAQFVICKVAP